MTKNASAHNTRLILGIVALVLIVVFTLQNAAVVTVNFLFWKLEVSRVILLLIVLLIGFLLGYIFHSLRSKR